MQRSLTTADQQPGKARSPEAGPQPFISIIVPARNEQAAMGDCLHSLSSQTGVNFEIIVVDDSSTDRTREIAQTFPEVRVLSAPPLADSSESRPTGKNHALICGASQACGDWLLFTDADTVHLPGSLARALVEAQDERVDLLSYSPQQVVITLTERAVMPVIFAELAALYPPHKVRDQLSGITAANGQYILVRRDAYEAVGGHGAVASAILEDVALARQFRQAGKRVYFRYAADAVRTRMYRNWPQLREGWTKNLALLFPRTQYVAFRSICFWVLAWLTLTVAVVEASRRHQFAWLALGVVWLLLYRRIAVAKFSVENNLIAIILGLPLFAYLLLRSNRAHAEGRVSWKGRTYATSEIRKDERSARSSASSERPTEIPIANLKHQN